MKKSSIRDNGCSVVHFMYNTLLFFLSYGFWFFLPLLDRTAEEQTGKGMTNVTYTSLNHDILLNLTKQFSA